MRRVMNIAIARKPFRKKDVAVLSSMFYLPLSQFDDKQLEECMKKFTIIVIDPYKDSMEDNFTEPLQIGQLVTFGVSRPIEVKMYDLSKPGFIGVPRTWGIEHYDDEYKYINRTIEGAVTLNKNWPTKASIKARDKPQQEFMDELANVCNGKGPKDILANASTGSGKTVVDLWLTIQLRLPTLVIVPTNRLKEQWLGSVEKKHGMRYFFGEAWVKKFVGIVQQDKCDYEDKLIVVGLSPSLARRDYGRDFYRHFGKITYDEVHKASTPTISEVLKKFPAKIRIGYTATNRTDALKKITETHLGKPKVISEQKVCKAKVYVYTYKQKEPMFSYSEFALLTNLSRLEKRNKFIISLIEERGLRRHRNILVLSDRIEQLQYLQDKLRVYDGIGLYVGEYCTGKTRLNRNGKRVKEKLKTTRLELDEIESNCQVILATYGMMELGVDIPRLDMGIEATPRGNVTQAIGRILRIYPDKKQPEWYSISDRIIDRSTISKELPKGKYYSKFTELSFARQNSFIAQKCTIKVVN